MKITVVTLFPELFDSVFSTSIIGRTIGRGIVEIEFVQIRDFAFDRYQHVDDKPFGGGVGMVMKYQPMRDALQSVQTPQSHTILMSASGKQYSQQKAHELSEKEHLIIVCGHYEGVDARLEKHVDEQISIGDYILTGGEPAAMVVMDSVIRLLEGAIKQESTVDESYENGLLEYPQYTQSANEDGECVPEVLLSGHHENIRKWRLYQSLKRTQKNRPDLYDKHELTEEEKKILEQFEADGVEVI